MAPAPPHLQGQFNFAEVEVEPLLAGINKVTVTTKKGGHCVTSDPSSCMPRPLPAVLEGMVGGQSSCLVSDKWLPVLVRQRAIQANVRQPLTSEPSPLTPDPPLQIASLVANGASLSTKHCLSNWLGRLRQISSIRGKQGAAAEGAGRGGEGGTPLRRAGPQRRPLQADFTLYA